MAEQANSYLGNLQSINTARNDNTMSSLRQLEQGRVDQKAKWLQGQAPDDLDELQKQIGISPDALTGARGVIKFGRNLKSVGAGMRAADEAKVISRAALVGGEKAGRSAQILQDALKGGREATSTIGKIVQPIAEGGKDIIRGGSTASGVVTALTSNAAEDADAAAKGLKLGASAAGAGGEAAAEVGASLASKALSGLGGAAAVATGGLAAGKDIEGLIEGKGWSSFGDNAGEKVANALEIGGSALTFVPGLDVLGGVAAAAGGIIDFFSEKSEAAKKKIATANKMKAINAETVQTPSSTRSVGMASLGMVSNMSRTSDTMSRGAGTF